MHQLAFPHRDWPERFKRAGVHALVAAVLIAVFPAILMYFELLTTPNAGRLAYELTHFVVAVLTALGLVLGFVLGLVRSAFPRGFTAELGARVLLDGRDLGPLERADAEPEKRLVTLVAERGTIRLGLESEGETTRAHGILTNALLARDPYRRGGEDDDPAGS